MERMVRMYAVMTGEAYTGVFSSRERAGAEEHDAVHEIEVVCAEGSPASGKYVFMAQGTWNMLTRMGERFVSEVIGLGPAWGMNPQSALSKLVGPAGRCGKYVWVQRLLMFEVDRAQVQDVRSESPFGSLVYRCQNGSLNDVDFTVDYVENYFDMQRRARESQEKRHCEAMNVLVEAGMNVNLEGLEAYMGEPMAKRSGEEAESSLRRKLSYRFERHELETLARMVQGRFEAVGDKSPQELKDLMVRYVTCLGEFHKRRLRRIRTPRRYPR